MAMKVHRGLPRGHRRRFSGRWLAGDSPDDDDVWRAVFCNAIYNLSGTVW